MRISDVMRGKGSTVAHLAPTTTVKDLLAELARRNIGAVVVSVDGATIAGIVSERDVVRALHERGVAVLDEQVESLMTKDVFTCAPKDTVDDLMHLMTERRIRHVPVVVDGALAGIVSIGDIVKSRMSELVDEREQLVGYISQS